MGHDELCLLSSIRPRGGPRCLVYSPHLEHVVAEMAEEIKAVSKAYPQDLVSVLRDSLALASDDEETWKPPGLTQWPCFDTCIAIGFFDPTRGGGQMIYWNEKGEVRAPGGRDVEVRRVYTDQDSVYFDYVVTGEPGREKMEKMSSDCTTLQGNPNFFVLEGCYRYLIAWLDWDSLSPRSIAFPNDPEPMSPASEFYEIVNTRAQPRNEDDPMGILPCISYGGMEKTCPQYQDEFYEARTGSKWTGRAIADGLRGSDLLPALIRDFGGWMCMRPDIWPKPSINRPNFLHFEDATPQGYFHNVPLEIFLDIVAGLPISTVVALSTTCCCLRNFLMAPETLNAVLRAAVLSRTGSLRWLRPVPSIHGEIEQAASAAQEWLTSEYTLIRIPLSDALAESEDPSTAFHHHSFPFYAFVPACLSVDTTLASMSMSSRRRLWGIIHQFEAIWEDYRTKGWERGEIFALFGAEESDSESSDDSLDSQPSEEFMLAFS